MKIPRYNDSTGGVNLQSNRSLTTGTQASSTLANVGKELIGSTLQYGAAKNSLTAKLRQLEIQTDINNAKSLLFKETSDFLNNLKNDDNYLAKPDVAFSQWSKKTDEWTKKYKGSVDEYTWKQLEPDFNFHIFEQGNKLDNEYVTKQKVVNGFKSLNLYNDTFTSKIKNASSVKDILGNWELYKKDIKGYDKLLLGKDGYEENFLTTKAFVNKELQMFQLTEGLIILSPNGKQQIDWANVEARARDTNFDLTDVDGKSVNANDRKTIIEEINGRKKDQITSHTAEREEKGRVEEDNFITEMIDIKNGKNPSDNTASYIDRIKNSNMTSEDKKTLSNAFFTWQSQGIKPSETTFGKNANIMANTLIAHGLIDTEQERSFISSLYGQGLITDSEYRTMNTNINNNIKKKNAHKKPLYVNAVKMIAKEIGDVNAVQLLQDVAAGGEVDIMSLMGSMDLATYDALNYFNLVLAEGEKQGFSFTEMLVDKTSKNYLMDDLTAYLKIAKDGKIDNNELSSAFAMEYGPSTIGVFADKPYHLGYNTFYQNKQPDVKDLPVPLKKENEPIGDYLARTQKYLMSINFKLPSTISGYQFENELDLNTMAIVPEIDDK
nr:hypothetical protein [uncultured Mediterranean phage uvMED]